MRYGMIPVVRHGGSIPSAAHPPGEEFPGWFARRGRLGRASVSRPAGALNRAAQAAATVLLRAYQVAISPWLPPACRYSPTCSQYALEAVARHGAARGLWMAARRLARCHPFHAGGYDPVR